MIKKEYNAFATLKDWIPLMESDPVVRSIFLNIGYSKEDWHEYEEAKNACDTIDKWHKIRSPKYDQMAKEYAEAIKRLKNL